MSPPEVSAAFRLAAITALQELVQMEALDDSASAESDPGPVVIARIELLHEPPGKFLLVLSPSFAAILAARYLPAGAEISAEIVDDVAGEFANVIAGQAKTMLKGTPYHFKQTTPTVKRVASLGEHVANQPAAAIRLCTESGEVLLLITL
jgi:CheY-specific phosphatase CheX